MIVPNILSGMSDLLSRTTRTDGDNKAAAATATKTASVTPTSAAASMREIVSRYDMTNITPNDFSSMIQQLYAKSAVSQQDMQELSSIRADLETASVGGDQPVNLQDFYQQRLTTAQADVAKSSDPTAAAANVQSLTSRLTWVQKFAAVRQDDGSAGLNAVA